LDRLINKKDRIFLKIAKNVSEFSTCVSFKVGSIIVKNNRIISTGYNGTPTGCHHCYDMFPGYCGSPDERERHHKWSQQYEIHSEINNILNAAKMGIAINDSVMYCTLLPCNDCLKAICNAGIKAVYFSNIYDKTVLSLGVLEMLNQRKVQLINAGDDDIIKG